MHKLGAELSVKGMSLYNHVAGKDDLLDGVVEVLWAEIEEKAPANDDWLEGARTYAHAIRGVLLRHPNAVPLIIRQSVMPVPALRSVRDHAATATEGGVPDDRAHALLRTITSYALGSAFAEVSWGMGGTGCRPVAADLVRRGIPSDLAAVAEVFCGECDHDAQFELGLDHMLRGIGRRTRTG